jgi:DNA invertase Pin-like site-specific DNA recombinase
MLGVFAEFETNLRKERQLEGIAKAKDAGMNLANVPNGATATTFSSDARFL